MAGTPLRAIWKGPQALSPLIAWEDPATHGPALEGVGAVYLVAPTDQTEQLSIMRPFLERAAAQVPGRLVLLSASSLAAGGPMMGEVHTWLDANAPLWTVLRPSWFMQNFTTQHLRSILDEGCLYSATVDGRVPFIDAADIAAAAVEALASAKLPSGEHVLTGPEALTYQDVAQAISARIGRPVSHRRLSVDELAARYAAFGIPQAHALTLARMDEAIAHGAEDRITPEVERITGRPAKTFAGFLDSQRVLTPEPL